MSSSPALQILAVDDELPVLRIVRRLLEFSGFEVETAEGGEAALEAFNREPTRFDCMLLDLSMPDLSGEVVMREIRKLAPELPIIVTSGYSAEDRNSEVLGSGNIVFLQKPWRREQLIEALEAAMGTKI